MLAYPARGRGLGGGLLFFYFGQRLSWFGAAALSNGSWLSCGAWNHLPTVCAQNNLPTVCAYVACSRILLSPLALARPGAIGASPRTRRLHDMTDMYEALCRQLMEHRDRFREEAAQHKADNVMLRTELEIERQAVADLQEQLKVERRAKVELLAQLKVERRARAELSADKERLAETLLELGAAARPARPKVVLKARTTPTPRGSLATSIGLKAKARPSKPGRAKGEVDMADL